MHTWLKLEQKDFAPQIQIPAHELLENYVFFINVIR